MKDLAGRTAIITGASAGIGKCVAEALAAEKMNVVLVARSADKIRSVARTLSATGVRVLENPADVVEIPAMQRMVERTIEEFGSIDVLVNNAGIDAFREYHSLDISEITSVIDVNLTASLILTRMVLPHMLRAQEGHIVNMSSTAGKHGPAFGAAYGASKAGLIAFTESLRGEYHGSGISASVVCPGFTHSGGIYDRILEETGRETPAVMGSATGKAVANAVVRAILADKPEVIVNRPPLRPMFVLAEMFPAVAEWCIRKTTSRFFKRVAQAKRQ
ncbi:MAG: SDR family NAD(P)-dependent oxidoreductase [Planctomycetaceae bacterium]